MSEKPTQCGNPEGCANGVFSIRKGIGYCWQHDPHPEGVEKRRKAKSGERNKYSSISRHRLLKRIEALEKVEKAAREIYAGYEAEPNDFFDWEIWGKKMEKALAELDKLNQQGCDDV